MHRRLSVVLLALVVALVFFCGCASEEPEVVDAIYAYELSIRATTPIENVTLLVPIPAQGGRPAIGHILISDEFYAEQAHTTYTDHLPKHYALAVVRIDDRFYLKVTASFMDSVDPIVVFYGSRKTLDHGFSPEIIRQMVETLYPFGNEPLFSPKQNLTLTAGSTGVVSMYGHYNPCGYEYSYVIPVYAYYESGTYVEIASRVEGSNLWGQRGDDSAFNFDDSGFNRYSDCYHLTITGSPEGWMAAEGTVTAGRGIYREWQLALSPTSGAG